MVFSFGGTFVTKILLPFIGFFLIVGGKSSYDSTSKFIDDSLVGDGQVISFVEQVSDDSSTYAPVINYFDVDGISYEFVSNTSSNPPAYDIGDPVEVLYLPSTPETAQIKSFFSLWGAAMIMLLVGIAFCTPLGYSLYSKIVKK